jgi:hypothetical protein
MRKVTRFELETFQYVGGGKMEAETAYEDGRFTFALSGGQEFTVSREELAALVEETEEAPAPHALVQFDTVAQVEAFIHRHRGRVVSLVVARKGGSYEQRSFECYRITSDGGRAMLFAYQLDHEHYERIPLCNVHSGRATVETFTPRYEVEL